MEQGGHSSIDVTVREYGAWIPKSDRSLIDRMNGHLAPARAALMAAAGGGAPTAAPTMLVVSTCRKRDDKPADVIEMSGFVGDSWNRRPDLNG
jgi:hypothetical protein